MKYTYEEIANELNNSIVIKRTDEAGEIWWIPVDEGNSDYQRYLNPDKVEHLTENPTEDVE